MVFGQWNLKPGFVVLPNHDTLKGAINLSTNYKNSRQCEFKGEGETRSRIFSPDELKSYVIHDIKNYVSREIQLSGQNKRVFLEYLVDGSVDLFYLNDGLSEYFFIEKENKLFELSNNEKNITLYSNSADEPEEKSYSKDSNQYKGMLIYLFQESPEVVQKINSAGFTVKSLTKLTVEYNRQVCKDCVCIDYTKSSK
jgi:hypothetical protein